MVCDSTNSQYLKQRKLDLVAALYAEERTVCLDLTLRLPGQDPLDRPKPEKTCSRAVLLEEGRDSHISFQPLDDIHKTKKERLQCITAYPIGTLIVTKLIVLAMVNETEERSSYSTSPTISYIRRIRRRYEFSETYTAH